MFKIVVIAILLINSIFWGFYPSSSVSIHQKIVDKLGLNIKLTYAHNGLRIINRKLIKDFIYPIKNSDMNH